MTWIRGGPPCVDAAAITAAVDGSLRRLGTDYIDLFQIHWWAAARPHGRGAAIASFSAPAPEAPLSCTCVRRPDRYVPMFGDVDYDPRFRVTSTPLEEQLEALQRAVGENHACFLLPQQYLSNTWEVFASQRQREGTCVGTTLPRRCWQGAARGPQQRDAVWSHALRRGRAARGFACGAGRLLAERLQSDVPHGGAGSRGVLP